MSDTYTLLTSIDQQIKASGLPLPTPYDPDEAKHQRESYPPSLGQSASLQQEWTAIGKHPVGQQLIDALSGNSPYLAHLLRLQAPFFINTCRHSPETTFQAILNELPPTDLKACSRAEIMTRLRRAKQQVALLAAISDIGGLWEVMTLTRHLSDFADAAIGLSVHYLLLEAAQRGECRLPEPHNPQAGTGLLILGMGKLGAHELNYSSDIDLIMLYDDRTGLYTGPRTIQYFFTKLAQDMVSLLQDRTAEGYVFRTDLRLRPDPRSTPLAVSLHSAIAYYESLGQNWERAAMIKARPILADPQTAETLRQHLNPFIWRKHLDFAAIADINSIKRQMAAKAGERIGIYGHNIKIGRGGIREIEFYVQTQQLVWGGRLPELRTKATLETLEALVEAELIQPSLANTLDRAYRFLRRVEHYLQMIRDEQTHTLPTDDTGFAHLATFLGYKETNWLINELTNTCEQVYDIYLQSVEGAPPLTVDGNLVFTGVEADPETLQTLARLGYQQPEGVSDIIQSWHRGSRRATRSKRARQILTELIPNILVEMADTANPDNALFRFDDFLANLPSGVQIFSLFAARPELLDLMAHIMGSAPALADILGKQPHLLDVVLHGGFYESLSDTKALREALTHQLTQAHDYEAVLSTLRTFKSERQFQAGVQMLRGITRPRQIGNFLSDLADVIVSQTITLAWQEFSQTHGEVPESELAVVALGKLGSRELTFGSDLDLIFIYHSPDSTASNGPKSVDNRTYYSRLCSRFISAFTVLMQEGVLYEIDTRLRPSGGDSPLATPLQSFDQYFETLAWTFEYMALTRARVIYASSPTLHNQLTHSMHHHLQRHHEPAQLKSDVIRMREKIFAQHRTINPWDIKQVRGGLIDLDFLAQYLVLRHAAEIPAIIQTNTSDVLAQSGAAGLLSPAMADELIEAERFLSDLLSFLRLCSPNAVIEATTPLGLKNLLVERFQAKDFAQLHQRLVETESLILWQFQQLSRE